MCINLWTHRTRCDTRPPSSLSDTLVLQDPWADARACIHCEAANILSDLDYTDPPTYIPGSFADASDLGLERCPVHGACCGLTRTLVCFRSHCGMFPVFHRVVDPRFAGEYDDLCRLRAGQDKGSLRITPLTLVQGALKEQPEEWDPRAKLFAVGVRAHRLAADMEELYVGGCAQGQIRHDLETLHAILEGQKRDLRRHWVALAANDVLEGVLPSDAEAHGGVEVFELRPSRNAFGALEELYQRPQDTEARMRSFQDVVGCSLEEWPGEDPAGFLPVTERVRELFNTEERAAMGRDGVRVDEEEAVEMLLRYNAIRNADKADAPFVAAWRAVDWNGGGGNPMGEEVGPLDEKVFGEVFGGEGGLSSSEEEEEEEEDDDEPLYCGALTEKQLRIAVAALGQEHLALSLGLLRLSEGEDEDGSLWRQLWRRWLRWVQRMVSTGSA